MKRTILSTLVLAAIPASFASASIVSGPVIYGGSAYYLISKNSWTGSEAEAQSMGGHLATVDDAAENAFLVEAFVMGGHISDPLWIGYTDAANEGSFVWASGSTSTFTNGQPGEPNNFGGSENYTALNWHYAYGNTSDHGTWNDVPDAGSFGFNGTTDGPYFGIVEVVPAPGALAIVGLGGLLRARRRR